MLALEAYLYYLLSKEAHWVFWGRSLKKWKTLPPRYGTFQMLLAHQQILNPREKLCLFQLYYAWYVPEQKPNKRLGGASKESTELLKVFHIFRYKLGSIHIRLGDPINFQINAVDEVKKQIRT